MTALLPRGTVRAAMSETAPGDTFVLAAKRLLLVPEHTGAQKRTRATRRYMALIKGADHWPSIRGPDGAPAYPDALHEAINYHYHLAIALVPAQCGARFATH